MNVITWIFFGLIAGAIAKLLMPGKDPGSWIVTMLLGTAGAVVVGWIGLMLWGSTGITGFNFHSFVLAIFGSVILLCIYRLFAGSSGTGTPSSGDHGSCPA
jgi:uncharacterized membrane protein YeaQ/YmgE (transglycosylase-associated protein family)